MLIKVIGASLIMAGTVGWGIMGVRRLRIRASVLRELTSSLDIMRGEICERCTPMPQLLKNLSELYRAPVSNFYRRAAEKLETDETLFKAWQSAVDESAELMLNEDEKSAMRELGLCLGKYDAQEQRTAIEYTRRRLSAFADKAIAQRDSESKLHAFLGVAAGIFAVMILL